jgi:hypothetical protein
MIAERFAFPNAQGHELAAALDLPGRKPRAYALFATASPAARMCWPPAASPPS